MSVEDGLPDCEGVEEADGDAVGGLPEALNEDRVRVDSGIHVKVPEDDMVKDDFVRAATQVVVVDAVGLEDNVLVRM